MENFELAPLLFFTTAGAAILFAIWSKKSVEARIEDDSARKSTLAKDGPDTRKKKDN